jgi:predicted nucleic acid-binding protein
LKVFFDATVLAGALINPTGSNARLLDLASMGGPLRGATSDVVALEFLRHAVDGDLGGARYELSDIEAFFDAYAPLFEIAQAPIGRALPQRTDLHNLPIGEIVFHLTGQTHEDLLSNLPDQPTLREFDVYDLHIVAAAVEINADAICTSDRHFEERIGTIEVYRPSQLALEFGLLS